MIQRGTVLTTLGLSAFAMLWPFSVFPQAVRPVNSVPHPRFVQAKLVSRSSGWAVVDQPSALAENAQDVTSQHLYWTDDDGQTWREITPVPMLTRNLGYIFFLDRSHAWILATDALGDQADAKFYLYSTDDGGKNWKSLLLQRPMFQLLDDYTFPSQVFFSDLKHGWIMWQWHMMNSSQDSLLATSDGGRTWKRLPNPPGGGPLQFLSPRDGWMIGGSENWQSVGRPEDSQIWVTHDGALHWRVLPISLPEPPASTEDSRTSFIDLRFINLRTGFVIAAQQLSGQLLRLFTCGTTDAGKSWHVSQFDAYHASPSFIDTNVIWSVSGRPAGRVSVKVGDENIEPTLPAGPAPRQSLGDLTFVTESNGWAPFSDGREELVSTTDGGRTLRIITPAIAANSPLLAPDLSVFNGIIVRFPRIRDGFALRPLAERHGPPVGSPAGGPMKLGGRGFLLENTVWIGTRSVHVSSQDGKTLLFLVPQDLPPGDYDISVENAGGRSAAIPATIGPPQQLRISRLQNRDPHFVGQPGIHGGQQVVILGRGFLIENTVWFGAQAVKAQLFVSMGATLDLEVPAKLAPGTYEVYVTNADGKSNVISTVVE